ncbi:expressed unknown protein [Seminavis robusta]|uniref:Uncharacterized protein n=1 Tax=Seminavis robusta TaxID=568900 RepID=A0A9N8HKN6_9STRA|nr:expressed unknown protein [Seminavis robusta]|eukprot:Sro747_g196470.1 n/a (214) ;mRNA; f:4159-4800
MEPLRQATALNEQGIHLVTSGQPNEALRCFKSGLALLATVAASEEAPVISPPAKFGGTTASANTSIVVKATDKDVFFEISSVESHHGVIHPSTDHLSLYSAALIFNCAIALERKASSCSDLAVAYKVSDKARRLLERSLQLLGMIHQARQFNCSEAITHVVRRLASHFHRMGDYVSVMRLLDGLMQLGIASAIVLTSDGDDADDKGSAHAPVA